MSASLLPLASSSWDGAEIEAMQKVIVTGQFTMGARVAEYERQFASFFGSKYCVMCSSGSTANLIMTGALFFRKENALKAGDEVIVPAVSWSTTFYPLYQYGLKLKFVDVDRETLNYDLAALKTAIGANTRLIMAVNLLGNPNDFSEIKNLISGRNIELIEDNCESMGATFESRQCGTFGLMGTFSSFFSHHISTMEGGCVVTDDEELYHILLCLRAHGWTRNLPKKNLVTGEKSDDAFEESFKFVLPGYNVRPLELSGAIGIEQLKKLPGFIRTRRENAAAFLELFGDSDKWTLQKETGQSSWFGFSFILNPSSGIGRREFAAYLTKNGVECRPIVTGNFAKNPVVRFFDHTIHGELKNANEVDTQGLFIGNHQNDIRSALRETRKVFERYTVKG